MLQGGGVDLHVGGRGSIAPRDAEIGGGEERDAEIGGGEERGADLGGGEGALLRVG